MKINLLVITLLSCLGFLSCLDNKYVHGKRSYIKHCSSCHMDDGSGIGDVVPSLELDMDRVRELGLIQCMIRNGVNNPDAIFKMVPNKEISDVDITNVINYLLNDMNKLDTIISIDDTKLALGECKVFDQIN
ncbi:MAG: hypothetical protein HKN67_11585 [Saprospiraceae bacterium]|nr:cytochrome c [Bacteroidia bacterium]MBT8230538.1 cytochrome c [Bacteroidia bacterium]NNF22574.1 hypothetical protein [Saprospiraceae bacterium]